MTYIANLAKFKVDLYAKDEGRWSNGSAVRAQTNGRRERWTDATKCIISLGHTHIVSVRLTTYDRRILFRALTYPEDVSVRLI